MIDTEYIIFKYTWNSGQMQSSFMSVKSSCFSLESSSTLTSPSPWVTSLSEPEQI